MIVSDLLTKILMIKTMKKLIGAIRMKKIAVKLLIYCLFLSGWIFFQEFFGAAMFLVVACSIEYVINK